MGGLDQASGTKMSTSQRETSWVDKIAIVNSLVDELEDRLASLETLGALLAAAHLDAAIDALCREFDVTRDFSEPE